MIQTVNSGKKELTEELQRLLESGRNSNGEEVFSCMLDDLIYFAALIDVQSSMLRLLLLHDTDVPQEMWEFSAGIMGMVETTLGKWERYADKAV